MGWVKIPEQTNENTEKTEIIKALNGLFFLSREGRNSGTSNQWLGGNSGCRVRRWWKEEMN
jgi:hypothetical protein